MRQVVPPWGRVFSGSIKVVVMEEEAPYPYEIEVTNLSYVERHRSRFPPYHTEEEIQRCIHCTQDPTS